MIDNIKLRVNNKLQFEHNLTKNEIVDLKTSINYFTGELYDYPKKGRLENLEISITEQSAYLKGSLHKYFNNSLYNEDHNYNDFSYCDLQYCIEELTEKLSIIDNTKLTNLEFGFNITTSINPSVILNNNILMFDLFSHNRDLKFQGKGNFKEFIKSDYSLKIYNKGKQYKKSENILRVELKITKSRELNKLGIFSIEDLLKIDVLTNLFNRLVDVVNKAAIIDEYTPKNILLNHNVKLKEYTNPNYWIKVRNDSNYKQFYKKRKEFEKLILNYNLDTIKQEIITKLNEKFIELLDCNYSSTSLDNIA